MRGSRFLPLPGWTPGRATERKQSEQVNSMKKMSKEDWVTMGAKGLVEPQSETPILDAVLTASTLNDALAAAQTAARTATQSKNVPIQPSRPQGRQPT